MSPQQIKAFTEKAQKARQHEQLNQKRSYKVGDTIVVNFCPFGKHPTRKALVIEKVSVGYKVQFTSTKGASCDGQNRKVYQRKDGKFVTLTEHIEVVTYDQVL